VPDARLRIETILIA